ncbi:MAG: two-component system, chemotaxis family, protein-glutamate methylesterase/glutaminase [Actinomycetota bacterium]|jgi:two-component system chemotaxis response regulator CheB
MKPTRVVVVESSPEERAHLVATLDSGRDITVVGQAAGAVDAIRMVQDLRPDVVILDLQIAGGGGQQVIEQLMAFAPTPILVLSASSAGRESVEAVDALVAGAVDVLPKPTSRSRAEEEAMRAQVRLVGGVTVVRHPRARLAPASRRATTAADRRSAATPLVAIGASTGGPAALAEILGGLRGLGASVLVVQHLHPDFVGGLVSWMTRVSPLPVELARHGEGLRAGVAYIAPGDTHLRVGPDDAIVLDPSPEMLHRPSVDVLFSSLAEREGGVNVAVLLTGMGDDGANGMLALRRRGDVTIAQDEATSVVFGMPRAAQRLGAAAHVVPLDRIAPTIIRALRS